MEKHVSEKLKSFGVNSGSHIGVAVSGGVDSMSLLHCLCSLSEQIGFTVSAYHMEHGIRGQSSQDDMRFVQQECDNRRVACIVRRADIPAMAAEQGLSVETAARLARYAFLDEQPGDFIATAHHMDDVAETVLMNLVRGAGLSGLCGIPEVRGRYIRPLLQVSRDEIIEYARINGVAYVCDATNSEINCTRNYIRHEIMPRLANVNTQAAAHIAGTARQLAEDDAALLLTAQAAGGIETAGDGVYIDIGRLNKQPEAIKKRIVRLAVAQRFGLVDVESKHIRDVLELAQTGVTAKRIDIGRGLIAAVVYDKLMIGKSIEKSYNYSLVSFHGAGSYELGRFAVTCEACDIRPDKPDGAEYFDAGALNGAVFRFRREGDKISPLGMDGSKRLSDYLSDRKVPLHLRDSLAVLAADDEIYWVAGVGVSEISKVKPGSQIMRITYREK